MSYGEFDPVTGKKKALKDKLVLRLFPYIQKQGFASLKMDDAAKYMDISKATMYKYFASKDEIIASLIAQCVGYISTQMLEEAPQQLAADPQSRPSPAELQYFGDTFAKAFKLSVKMAFYLTDPLLQDLSAAYPELSAELTEAVERCQRKLTVYFDSGMELGIFNRMNSHLIRIQLDVVLRKLLDPKLLMQHNMTLKQALLDFYLAMKHQIFRDQWIHTDTDEIEPYINGLILKMLASD